MDDLVQWVGEQLDEDQRIARACSGAPWEIEVPPMVHVGVRARRDNKWKWGRLGYVASVERDEDRAHIATHDPARVLREIDAKRQLVERYERAMENRRAHPDDPASAGALLALHGAVKLLALPYADRPGYREEWRP